MNHRVGRQLPWAVLAVAVASVLMFATDTRELVIRR